MILKHLCLSGMVGIIQSKITWFWGYILLPWISSCGHLLGKGWPLGSCLWCPTVSLSLSHWYPGSGVVLDCIDSWSLHPYLLCRQFPPICFVKSIIFSQFWPEAFSQNCWRKPWIPTCCPGVRPCSCTCSDFLKGRRAPGGWGWRNFSLQLKNMSVIKISSKTLCMLCNFACFFCCLLIFFSKLTFVKHSFRITIIRVSKSLKPDPARILLGLTKVQTVCKSYQQTTKVAASEERVKPSNVGQIFFSIFCFTDQMFQYCQNTSFLPRADFCSLLITFANSSDPDQDWLNIYSELNPNFLPLCKWFWKIFLKNLILKKSQQITNSSSMQRVLTAFYSLSLYGLLRIYLKEYLSSVIQRGQTNNKIYRFQLQRAEIHKQTFQSYGYCVLHVILSWLLIVLYDFYEDTF